MYSSGSSETDERTESTEQFAVARRGYLKASGIAISGVIGAASRTDVATASSDGYGGGGYGRSGYGNASGPTVTSGEATEITATAATVSGTVTDLGAASSVTAFFEWRPATATEWKASSKRTLTATGSYSVDLSAPSSGTVYEYRAVVADGTGDGATGAVRQFTTPTANAAPTIESFSVTEAGSPDPHAEISVDWSVADTDGNLDIVIVEVFDDAGAMLDGSMTEVGGATVTGSEHVKVKHVDGERFEVLLTVVDTHGGNASRIRTVSE